MYVWKKKKKAAHVVYVILISYVETILRLLVILTLKNKSSPAKSVNLVDLVAVKPPTVTIYQN